MERRRLARWGRGQPRRCAALLAAVVVAAVGLSGCGSISEKFADTASQTPGIGLPANAPERPSTPVAYPAVHDIPAPRNSVTLTNFEQQKLEDDLVAARDSQQTSVGITTQAKKLEKAKAEKEKLKAEKEKLKQSQRPIAPGSSSQSIY